MLGQRLRRRRWANIKPTLPRAWWGTALFCETQWPRPPLFSPSWLIQWSMGEDSYNNLVFTEWRHCVSQNEVWGRGCHITLFSPSDVTAFHRIRSGRPRWLIRIDCGLNVTWRIFLIVVVHIQCSKLFKEIEYTVLSLVPCTMRTLEVIRNTSGA